MAVPSHIHPVQHRLVQRAEKEALIGQHGVCVWMTGLSGSGKSTIAIGLERELHQRGRFCTVLDGDNVRTGINNNLGFSDADRMENVRRIAEIAKLLVHQGVIVVCCFVSPTITIRERAKAIIGADDFIEVFVDTPLDVCQQRDVKGLYAEARSGGLKDLTGVSAPFEAPPSPSIRITTADRSEGASTHELLSFILPRVQLS